MAARRPSLIASTGLCFQEAEEQSESSGCGIQPVYQPRLEAWLQRPLDTAAPELNIAADINHDRGGLLGCQQLANVIAVLAQAALTCVCCHAADRQICRPCWILDIHRRIRASAQRSEQVLHSTFPLGNHLCCARLRCYPRLASSIVHLSCYCPLVWRFTCWVACHL